MSVNESIRTWVVLLFHSRGVPQQRLPAFHVQVYSELNPPSLLLHVRLLNQG